MERVLWHLQTASGSELFGVLWRPILLGFVLYYSSYLGISLRALWRRAGFGVQQKPATLPPALIVLPTLLRKPSELTGLKRAVLSIVANDYPGRLLVCPSIDHGDFAPALVMELHRWAQELSLPEGTQVHIVSTPERGGKSMAIDAAIESVVRMVARGELAAFPPVFFNMDADSELADGALWRMAACLSRPGRLSGRRPMIVASNVCVRPSHYWQGWRAFFTLRGQLALQVAREYMNSISLARVNTRLIPVTSVSGALYCTWSDLAQQAPRYAGFLRTLRPGDLARWWFGARPPSFSRSDAAALPEATTGPGDDTWIAWLAMCARWRGDRVCLELPRTPVHALLEGILGYLFRPIAYDPAAKVFTDTPTTVRGLFKQRVRWNSSRIWLIQRFGWSMWFHWRAGFPIYLDVAILVGLHAVILLGLLLSPVMGAPANWLAILFIVNIGYMFLRGSATVLAMIQDGSLWSGRHKLLALPLAGLYHLVFNVFTTVTGFWRDLLGSGVNTHFAPEQTLIRAGTGRVALAYRLRRVYRLSWRALRRGDVPLGKFWFGWQRTRWTDDGYRGWDRR